MSLVDIQVDATIDISLYCEVLSRIVAVFMILWVSDIEAISKVIVLGQWVHPFLSKFFQYLTNSVCIFFTSCLCRISKYLLLSLFLLTFLLLFIGFLFYFFYCLIMAAAYPTLCCYSLNGFDGCIPGCVTLATRLYLSVALCEYKYIPIFEETAFSLFLGAYNSDIPLHL